MNTLQTLVNIALNKPAYRERALHQLRRLADTFHAMEVEREFEEMASVAYDAAWHPDAEIFIEVFELIGNIRLSKKNGALA